MSLWFTIAARWDHVRKPATQTIANRQADTPIEGKHSPRQRQDAGTYFENDMINFFAELVQRTDEDRRAFETHPLVLDAVANGLSLERYRALLLELYHVVWHFNPTCAAAASRMGAPGRDSLQPIRHFLFEHMHEEMGHEDWVLADLQAIGVNKAMALSHEPGIATLSLNGFNYWAADRGNPCAVLGMMYVLEVVASVYGGPFADAIRKRLFLEGEQGLSFIGSHASLDARHMAELREVLNRVEDKAAQQAIVQSTRVNFHQLVNIVKSVDAQAVQVREQAPVAPRLVA